jgi:hypothetical protein
VEDHIENQQQVLQILKDNLTMAQNRMKQQADQHRSERSFEVGDWVFLRLQPYKQMSLKQAKKDNKLSPKYYGPSLWTSRLTPKDNTWIVNIHTGIWERSKNVQFIWN